MSAELWTWATPNGWKVSIMWEELREAGIDLPELIVRKVNIGNQEQFTPEFTRINPNQKIPALVHDGVCIMESCAILHYLAEHYPSSLCPLDEHKWNVLPWVYWQAANLGPNFGNKLSYTRYMDDVEQEQKKHPLERFNKESQRLLSVFANQLADKPYLCGELFTIADIACYPWIRGWKWSKIAITGYENIVNWVNRVRERPGVERGITYGVTEEERDKWSSATKGRFRKNGID
jgi:GST-like protein